MGAENPVFPAAPASTDTKETMGDTSKAAIPSLQL
jgi:hypothetical protein